MKIITQSFADSEKLYNYLLASSIHDDFYLDNLFLQLESRTGTVEIRGWNENDLKIFI